MPSRMDETNLSLFLQIECIDLLELSLKLEEERALVCLKGSLWVLDRLSSGWRLLRINDRSGAQSFDKLRVSQPIEYNRSSSAMADLLQRLVIHEAGGIFGNLQLSLLNVLSKLPAASFSGQSP